MERMVRWSRKQSQGTGYGVTVAVTLRGEVVIGGKGANCLQCLAQIAELSIGINHGLEIKPMLV
jgi:hypothetical protein